MTYYNLDHLQTAIRAREIASTYYLYNPRVTLIDVGWKIKDGESTDEMAVRVHVRNKPREAVFEAMVERSPQLAIDKEKIPFPCDIIEASYKLQSFGYPYQTPARARRFNPLKGGISVSSEWIFGYGTLGGIVEDRESGDKMILSNWHVLSGSAYFPNGLKIFQPGYGDGGSYRHTIATLERHAMDQGIDAAVARLTGARQFTNEQLEIGAVTGSRLPILGMRVVKSGRASNVTYGVIDGVEGEYPIRYGGYLHRIRHVHRIVPQPGKDEVSRAGDSGSWWLDEDTRDAVGLHFAGFNDPETALAISMPQVLEALNVSILTETLPVEAVTAGAAERAMA